MKFGTPAVMAPGSWSVGMICSLMALIVSPSATVKKRQGPRARLQAGRSVAAPAAAVTLLMNCRRGTLVLRKMDSLHSALPSIPRLHPAPNVRGTLPECKCLSRGEGAVSPKSKYIGVCIAVSLPPTAILDFGDTAPVFSQFSSGGLVLR